MVPDLYVPPYFYFIKKTMFEYKILKFNTTGLFGGKVNLEEIEVELNKLGAEGWELISTVASNEAYGTTKEIVYIFKRKK